MINRYVRPISTILVAAFVLAIIPWNSIAGGYSEKYIVHINAGQIGQVKQDLANMGLYPEAEIEHASNALIVDLTPSQVNRLSLSKSVKALYQDAPVKVSGSKSYIGWGLDRLDSGTEELDNTYYFPENAGKNVRIYVLDTGVRADHFELSNRVLDGYDVYGENLANVDCNGHGTHVAGIAAGRKYGVAQHATIVPVRVLDCDGVGYFSDLIKGLNWVAETHPQEMHGIINLSISGVSYDLINSAIESLYNENLLTVVAAGNYGSNACNYSPANSEVALTVGSIDKDFKRSGFSNYGDCVDIYAPGFYVRSADASSAVGSSLRSGTSQSAPYATGTAAVLFSEGLVDSPREAINWINFNSIKDVVTETNSFRDNLLQSFRPEESTDVLEPEPTPEPIPEPEPVDSSPSEPGEVSRPEIPAEEVAPEPEERESNKNLSTVPYVLISDTTNNSVSFEWGAVSDASRYRIIIGFVGEELVRHSRSVVNSSKYEFKGLLPVKDYWLQITAHSNIKSSLPTEKLEFSTKGFSPSAPRDADVFRNILNWREPAKKGGSNNISYLIQKRTDSVWEDFDSTYETEYTVAYPKTGTDLYRVVSVNEYGTGEATQTLYIRPKAPQIEEPVVEEPEVQGITIAQKQAGSAFVILGWEPAVNVDEYVIQRSENSGETWTTVAATKNTEALTIAWLNRAYVFRVVAQDESGNSLLIGSAEYFGK